MIGPPVVIPMTDSARDALIANVVLLFGSAIFVFLRIYGRITGPGLGIDDVLAVVALVGAHSRTAPIGVANTGCRW